MRRLRNTEVAKGMERFQAVRKVHRALKINLGRGNPNTDVRQAIVNSK